MKKLIYILIPLVFSYLTIVFAFYADQRNLIFVPTKLTQSTPKDFGLTSYDDIKFKNPEGEQLNGWWIHHDDGQTHPVLLYCHGNAANLSLLSQVSKLFYDYGFDALLFDYRSYGSSEGSSQELSEKTLDEDAQSAYQWLKDKNIDEKTIILWGQSLGSSVAAELAAQNHPAGLILEGAFPSIYAVSRFRYPWLLLFPFMVNDKFPTEFYVTQRTCPLLQIHGEMDTLIPISLGQEVYAAAVNPKQWLSVPGMNHNDFPSLAMQYQPQIMDWVQKCESTPTPN